MNEDEKKPEKAPGPATDVYPLFGPEHVMSDDCWCSPYRDVQWPSVRIHRVMN